MRETAAIRKKPSCASFSREETKQFLCNVFFVAFISERGLLYRDGYNMRCCSYKNGVCPLPQTPSNLLIVVWCSFCTRFFPPLPFTCRHPYSVRLFVIQYHLAVPYSASSSVYTSMLTGHDKLVYKNVMIGMFHTFQTCLDLRLKITITRARWKVLNLANNRCDIRDKRP